MFQIINFINIKIIKKIIMIKEQFTSAIVFQRYVFNLLKAVYV